VSDVLLVNVSQVIGKARVPIIKFVEKKSGLSFDIRFDDILLFDF
jgi:non-canonical poly(A) RNA polymerase PAPD5/7